MNLNEAIKILENDGYEIADDSISLESEIKRIFINNNWKCIESFERSGGVHIIFSLISSSFVEIDLFIKGERFECDYFLNKDKITHIAGDFDSAKDLYSKLIFEKV